MKLETFNHLHGGIFGTNVKISLIVCSYTHCICEKCSNNTTFQFRYNISNDLFQNENSLTTGSRIYHSGGPYIHYDSFLIILSQILSRNKIKRKLQKYDKREEAFHFSFNSISSLEKFYKMLLVEIHKEVSDKNNVNNNDAVSFFN